MFIHIYNKFVKESLMIRNFTLEYWRDDEWFIGRLREIPNVMSQGETLEELQENIIDAYKLVINDMFSPIENTQTVEMTIEI
jgi:predicted RNase H-like HicB family nuclease